VLRVRLDQRKLVLGTSAAYDCTLTLTRMP
jgi:hypothetical protein